MSTPPQDPRGHDPLLRSEDRTRDIRLPSLPDRPPSAVRPEWQAHVQSAATVTSAVPAPAAEQPVPINEEASPATAMVLPDQASEPAPPRPYVLPDEPTDEMSSPPRARQQTLAFDVPPAASAPVAPPAPAVREGSAPITTSAPSPFFPPAYSTPSYASVHGAAPVPERNRRWPWVVLTVLPILVIIGAGLMLIFLLRGG